MIEFKKKNIEKFLGNPIVMAVIGIGTIVFVTIGSFFIGLPPTNIIIILMGMYILSIATSLLIGLYIFRYLNMDTIDNFNNSISAFNEIANYWKFKDLVVDSSDYIDKKEMIVFGVNFSLTGGNSSESDLTRKNLLKKNRITYICTPLIEEDYPLILDNIKMFLQKVNYDKIKGKIEIYRRKDNPLNARVILYDRNLGLYQPRFPGSDEFRSQIRHFAIKIDDEITIQKLHIFIDKMKSESEKIDLEKIWQELQKPRFHKNF